MDFDDTPDEAAWRAEVRAFLEAHREELGAASGERAFDNEASRRRQALLYDAGYVGVTWPEEAGGRGGTPMQQAIIDQEMARLGVPGLINLIGIGMCGPTVIAHGSEDQKQRYLKRLLRAEDVWCQLFSEPASGSDLAALRTKAVQDGEGNWHISGQKVWTTLAHLADYGILLTRTDPDVAKHRGLTMFVVNMKDPAVTVRPLKQMSGGADFNEVFFDDLVVPDSERLGEVGDGWRVALTTLMSERLSLGVAAPRSVRAWRRSSATSPSGCRRSRPSGRHWSGRTSAGPTSPRSAAATPATASSPSSARATSPARRRRPAS